MSDQRKEETSKPWGSYKVLYRDTGFCVKHIEVKPGERLSLQRHLRRAEEWIITRGEGLVRISDEKRRVTSGDTIRIDVEQVHRIENVGNEMLVFVEVSLGDYIEEDDIERIEDDYNRA